MPIEDGTDPKFSNATPARLLCILLLSRSAVSDAKLRETMERIQHFSLLTGGRDLLILFLLNPPNDTSFTSAKELTKNDGNNVADEDAIVAYAKLQAELFSEAEIPYLPIRPILSIDELQTTIEKHITALKTQEMRSKPPSIPFELLKSCTVNPPMSEQTAYIISDIFADLKDLAATCSAISSAPNSSSPSAIVDAIQSSQTYALDSSLSTLSTNINAVTKLKHLRDLVGVQECQNVVDFWKVEWLL